MEQINLNLIPNGILAVCHVSQYDNTGRKIRFHLFNGSDTYALSGTETITLRIRKTNSEILIFDIPNTASDYIELTVLQQMTDVSGVSVCEFRLTDSGLDIGSFNFKMKIEPDAFDGNLSISEVSGNIATFKTDLAEDLIKLDVDLEPIQDLHGYDGAWPAGGGKNIAHFNTDNLDNSQQCTVTYIDDNNLSIDVMGNYARAMYAITCPENTTVTVSFKGSSTANYKKVQISAVNSWSGISWYRIFTLTEQETTYSYTFTTSADSTTIYIGFYVSAGANTGTMHIKDFQIEKGSVATSFVPYSNICPITGHDSAVLNRAGSDMVPVDPTPITVQFGQTVYKGKLYSKLRKVLVTHVGINLGDIDWTIPSSANYFLSSYLEIEPKGCPVASTSEDMCSHYKGERYANIVNGTIPSGFTIPNTIKKIYLHDQSKVGLTAEQFKTAVNGITLVYEVEEPFYIDLSQEQTENVEKAATASFETNIQRPLETSEHYFSCSQAEGTPTPDSPIPITGVSGLTAARIGKNLCSPMSGVSENGLTTTVNSDGTIHVTGTATGSGGYITDVATLGRIIPANQQIIISIFNSVTARLRGFLYGESNTGTFDINQGETSTTFSKDFSTSSIRLYLFTTAGQSYDFSFKFQVELGSVATPYEPYSYESMIVSFGGTYYGGKLVQKEDGSRKLLLDKKRVKISDLTWSYVSLYTYFQTDASDMKRNDSASQVLDGLMCEIYTNRTAQQAGSGNRDLSIAGLGTNIRIKHLDYDNKDAFVAAVGDHDIVYPLAEPIEVSLPDGDPLTTLAGENNVYCNTGDTALAYYFNMVADPIRIPALVGTNNVYSDAGDVDVEYYTIVEGGND